MGSLLIKFCMIYVYPFYMQYFNDKQLSLPPSKPYYEHLFMSRFPYKQLAYDENPPYKQPPNDKHSPWHFPYKHPHYDAHPPYEEDLCMRLAYMNSITLIDKRPMMTIYLISNLPYDEVFFISSLLMKNNRTPSS